MNELELPAEIAQANAETKPALKNIYPSERGQGLTEYAVVLSLVAVASIAAMAFFGTSIKAKLGSVAGSISGQGTSEVGAADKRSTDAAKAAQKTSEKAHGMKIKASGPGSDIIDDVAVPQ